MRLQVIRAGIEYEHTNGHKVTSNEDMSEVFQKIERDIETLFSAIESKSDRMSNRFVEMLFWIRSSNDCAWDSTGF